MYRNQRPRRSGRRRDGQGGEYERQGEAKERLWSAVRIASSNSRESSSITVEHVPDGVYLAQAVTAQERVATSQEASMSSRIDPYDLIAAKNYGSKGTPHDVWTLLRKESPVHRCEFDGDFEDFWAITKHADIIDISSKPHLFSNREGPMILNRGQKIQAANRAASPLGQMRTIIEMDPPEHRDFRNVAKGFFTPRSIRRLDEIVTESARALIDSLGEEGECDFVEKVAQRHPLRVLATILGIDREDEERVLELTQQLFASDDPDLQRKGEDRAKAQMELGLEFYQMFDRITQDRRARPRDDLATMLATATMVDGQPMGPIETFGYYLIVFTAGHDTTRNALSAGFAAMLENPDQLELLRK